MEYSYCFRSFLELCHHLEVVFTYFFSISLKSQTNSEPNIFSITGNSAHLPPRDIHATKPLNELLPLGIIQLFPKVSGGRIPGKSIDRSIEQSLNKIPIMEKVFKLLKRLKRVSHLQDNYGNNVVES